MKVIKLYHCYRNHIKICKFSVFCFLICSKYPENEGGIMVIFFSQVVDIMKTNVEKVLERDQKLSELDDRAGKF